jgi:hypothetical protein
MPAGTPDALFTIVVLGPDSGRWARRIGCAGYAARAAVYGIIAGFGLDAALRLDPSEPKGLGEAFRALVARPGGRWLLALLALLLLMQVAWRALQALTDVETRDGRPPGLARRVGHGLVGLFYAGLFGRAAALVLGVHGDSARRSALARVLAHPFGRLVSIGVGVGLLVFAAVELRRAWRSSFLDDFGDRALSPRARCLVQAVGRAGLGVRGLVFALGGVLLAHSGWRARADTLDVGDVLREVAHRPFGIALVGLIAVGLFAYAALMIGEAVWRRDAQR